MVTDLFSEVTDILEGEPANKYVLLGTTYTPYVASAHQSRNVQRTILAAMQTDHPPEGTQSPPKSTTGAYGVWV